MDILCLMPTYGRAPWLLENSLACFASQTYDRKALLIFDDLGTLAGCECDVPGVTIWSQPNRMPSLPSKYNRMLMFGRCWWDAVAVWDDDDIYLPEHLAAHAAALQDHGWSKPSRVLSTYTGRPEVENAVGRFHGSIAIRRDHLGDGWPETSANDFDQRMIGQLSTICPPGELQGPLTYCYRWGSTRHQHWAGPSDREWYGTRGITHAEPIATLAPQFDVETASLI